MDGRGDDKVAVLLDRAASRPGPAVILTGPGLIEESGVASMRGDEALWRVGSRVYHPVELATWMTFQRLPAEVWGWYLFRRASGRCAFPNAAHVAIASLERRLGDRFLLVTENVHGLHLRAGNSHRRTLQIHGNIDHARCAAECDAAVHPLPEDFAPRWEKDRPVGDAERAVLTCPRCDGWLRPNVLWFDEAPDEARYRSDSALQAASEAAVLVAVGTSHAPSLPTRMCKAAVTAQVPFLVVDPEPGPLSELASASAHGYTLAGTARAVVPGVCAAIAGRLALT